MPRKVTAWACEFKCGFKVYINKNRILIHEDGCFSNPEKRACKTCANFIAWGVDDFESPYCKDEYFDKPYKKNPHGLRTDCKKWKQKTQLPS